jgi:hypothetical protein
VSNRLLRNNDGIFEDVTSGPLGDTADGNGVAWGDYDNDGDLDLYVVNYFGSNRLLRNEGPPDWSFVDRTISPLDNDRGGRGVAWGDYDNDGDLDIYLANYSSGNKLFKNGEGSGNHWIHVNLRGTVSNTSAIGARVRVVSGGASQIRELSAGSGFLSQNSLAAEFGLGTSTVVDTLEVRWPSGTVQRLSGLVADQFVLLVEDDGTGVHDDLIAQPRYALHGNFPNPFNPSTMISYELPGRATVSLRVYNMSGRLVRDLVDSELHSAGLHARSWDGRDNQGRTVASGVYYCRLTADGQALSRHMVLLK